MPKTVIPQRRPLFAKQVPQVLTQGTVPKKKKGAGKMLAILIILILAAVLITLVILLSKKISP